MGTYPPEIWRTVNPLIGSSPLWTVTKTFASASRKEPIKGFFFMKVRDAESATPLWWPVILDAIHVPARSR